MDFLTTHCPPLATGGASKGEEARRAARPGLLAAEVSAAAASVFWTDGVPWAGKSLGFSSLGLTPKRPHLTAGSPGWGATHI